MILSLSCEMFSHKFLKSNSAFVSFILNEDINGFFSLILIKGIILQEIKTQAQHGQEPKFKNYKKAEKHKLLSSSLQFCSLTANSNTHIYCKNFWTILIEERATCSQISRKNKQKAEKCIFYLTFQNRFDLGHKITASMFVERNLECGSQET